MNQGHDSNEQLQAELESLRRRVAALEQTEAERQQMRERRRRRAEAEKLIANISMHFIGLASSEIEAGINHALRAVGEFSDVDSTYVFLISEDGKTMSGAYEWCREGIEPRIDNLQGLPTDMFPWGMAKLRRHETIHIPRVSDLPPEANAERSILQAQDIQSLLAIPMVSNSSLVGFLGFSSVRSEKIWLEEDIALLQMTGDVFENALTRKRGEQALREAKELGDALNSINSAIGSTLEIDEIMQNVVAESAKALGADASNINLRQGDTWVLTYGAGPLQEAIGECSSDEVARITALVARERKPIAIEDTHTSPLGNPVLMDRYGFRASLNVPLIVRQEVIGVLGFNWSHPVTFSEAQLDFAQKLSASVSLALENARLYESERRERYLLETIMENTHAHLAYLDTDFNFVRVNSAYAAGCGYESEELIGRNHFKLFPNAENQAIFEKVRDTGEPVRFFAKPFQYPNQPERGVTYWDWTLVPVKGRRGRTHGLVLSLLDVTEMVRARKEIESLARFPAEDPNPVFRISKDGIVLYANAGSQPLLQTWGCQIGSPLPQVGQQVIHDVLEHRQIRNIEATAHGRVYELMLTPVSGTDYVNVYGRDITERKRAERERQRLERMKDEFFANVSHELRTPLASIMAYIELLLDEAPGELSSEQCEFLQTAFESSQRLSRLVEDLLEVSRVQAGRLRFEHEPLQLAGLIQAAVDSFRPAAQEASVNLAVHLTPHLPELEGDPWRLEQVLGNLLSNAIRFTPPGGHVVVSARVHDESRIAIEVRDTGIGIPAHDIPHIFDRFYQADNVSDSNSGGTGLGLYIAKAIVEAHGGHIEVESEVGKGSTFRVLLPVS